MLQSLFVKNLALIKEVEVNFKDGLNILTGETGAGKSIIIDSINLALGGKITKEMIREDADYAFVELVFCIKDKKQLRLIKDMEFLMDEENQIILSRKIMNGRSISKVNGETVSISRLREAAQLLIAIHGQHEHQTLLHKKNHLEIVDEFGKAELEPLLSKLRVAYQEYQKKQQLFKESKMDESKRLREISLLQFECNEIEEADIKPKEDEELEGKYSFLLHAQKIISVLTAVHDLTAEGSESAANLIGSGIKELAGISSYDEKIQKFNEQLVEMEGLLNDFNLDVAKYIAAIEYDGNEISFIEERLNIINHIKMKYGQSVEQIENYKTEIQKKLEIYQNYDAFIDQLMKEIKESKKEIEALCHEISEIRAKKAALLANRVKNELKDLSFLDVKFEIQVKKMENYYSEKGYDEIEFMISTNPGEEVKPINKIASGGELSRIMLAIKTVMSGNDNIETLVFDEIDAGISGRAAQMVSEKLSIISKNCQVICITHLPQIAAMADFHFGIQKNVENNVTKTYIHELKEEEMISEIARLIGGARITETVLKSAKEMKELAKRTIKY